MAWKTDFAIYLGEAGITDFDLIAHVVIFVETLGVLLHALATLNTDSEPLESTDGVLDQDLDTGICCHLNHL